MNFTLLQQTDIPDLAPVYGGARGRTMSSRHQANAWGTLQEAGVETIIDLREKDTTARLTDLCRLYDMRYFHYPVHTMPETIKQMVVHFPEFCQHIDAGNFYIACAMGLHRTDIALCAYWMFYAADKGLQPPAIRGYREEDGHNTDKINRVLNAMYQAFIDCNGTAPIPMDVFKARKVTIKNLSIAEND